MNARDATGMTPLHLAAWQGQMRVVRMLLARKDIDVNAPGVAKATPLHAAADRGDPQTVALLLKAGADPNAKDDNGETPLDYAERREWAELVSLLKAAVTAPAAQSGKK